MINIQVLSAEKIIILEPGGALEEADFQKLEKEIKAFLEDKDRLAGLIIHTKSFPGWDDLSAFKHHMKFVKEHHKKIQRVAIVTDSKLGEIGPAVAQHFVSPEMKHFSFGELDEAKHWIQGAV